MKYLITFIFTISLGSWVCAQTTITSDITVPTTWNIAGSPYTIAADVSVLSGITLTVDPGVEVFFQGNTTLTGLGDIQFAGTQNDSIYLRKDPGSSGLTQGNIEFAGKLTASYVSMSFLNNGFQVYEDPNGLPLSSIPELEVSHSYFFRNTVAVNHSPDTNTTAFIDSCVFAFNTFAFKGQQMKVAHCSFIQNAIGILGYRSDIDSCSFLGNSISISTFLPMSITHNVIQNSSVGIQLDIDDPGNLTDSLFILHNDIIDNREGIQLRSDSMYVNPQLIDITGNTICNDSSNLNFQIYHPLAIPSSLPTLDMSLNCWCEYDVPSILPTVFDTFGLSYTLAPLDSSCLPSVVMPGDANFDQVANNVDLLSVGLYFGENGPMRPNASLAWSPQICPDWDSLQTNGVDLKHADTDGNGTIDWDDTLAINLNYGLTHNFQRRAGILSTNLLWIDMPAGPYTPGDTLHIPIHLGTVDTPAVDVYGLAFSISFDPSLLDSTFGVKTSYANSWLGTKNVDLLTLDKTFFNDGKIDLALCRNDQVGLGGHGIIAKLIVVISDDLAKKERPMKLAFPQAIAIDSLGNPLALSTRDGSSVVEIGTLSDREVLTGITLYPNPAKDQLSVSTQETSIQEIHIYSLRGEKMRSLYNIWKSDIKLDLSLLETGMYIVEINTEAGINRSKILKQ